MKMYNRFEGLENNRPNYVLCSKSLSLFIEPNFK